VAAPYRDGVFSELQRRLDLHVYLLARDEPGRNWRGRRVPYRYTVVPAIQLPGARTPWYLPLPQWLFRRGYILVAGFGLPALITATVRPRSTLIWSEATAATERGRGRLRTGIRRWLVRRSRGAVAVGHASTSYLQALGAEGVLVLPNVIDASPNDALAIVGGYSSRSSVVLCHVGDWSIAKGADRTARVFEIVRNRFKDLGVPVELVIAGQLLDVPLPRGSEYLGYLPHDQVWDSLRRLSAKFLLLMSQRDTWGFVVAEAMAAGIVPIASVNVGSADDLLTPARPELVVRRDEDAAEVIYRLYVSEEEMASTVAALYKVAQSRSSQWAAERFCSDFGALG
jgi:glycosyltransferase involved in cell wall biosynthesis